MRHQQCRDVGHDRPAIFDSDLRGIRDKPQFLPAAEAATRAVISNEMYRPDRTAPASPTEEEQRIGQAMERLRRGGLVRERARDAVAAAGRAVGTAAAVDRHLALSLIHI